MEMLAEQLMTAGCWKRPGKEGRRALKIPKPSLLGIPSAWGHS